MNVDMLIEENNRKRELLTPENEKYYDDMLIYIRLQWRLSEQQSEEVLMEILDHLLQGQEEGKTAKDMFGHNPKAFADEIIEQLPNEKKREIIPFYARIIGNIVSWSLIIRGFLHLILSQFIEVNSEINLFQVAMSFLAITCFVSFCIWFILRLVHNSLFKENRNIKLLTIKAGFVGAAGMAVVLLVAKFTPEIGPSYNLPWQASLIAGAILWLILFVEKKR